MMTQEEVNERFRDVPMVFKTHYKGSFSYRGEDFELVVKAGASYESFSDAAYHQVDTDKPPEFGSVDDWHWVKVVNKKTEEVVFEKIVEWW